MQSIIPGGDDRICFLCLNQTGLERHHVWFGTANRKLSEEDGLTVNLCSIHHRGRAGVHGRNLTANKNLKRIAEACWIQKYQRTAEEFTKRYGANVLEWDEIERIEQGTVTIEDYISEILYSEEPE